MKTTKRWDWSRIATVVTTVGVLGFPVVSAQAKPPKHAPAWGYRDKDNDKRDSDDRTLDGVVTRDYAGHTFEMRTDAGRSVTVRVDGTEPGRLSRGDTVRVQGETRRGIFVATSVTMVNNRGGNNANDRTLNGVVTRDYAGRTFEMRTDAGRSVTVRVDGTEPGRLSRGDTVRVEGKDRNGVFVATRVRVVNNRGGDNDYAEGRSVSFDARIIALDSKRDYITVRGDNGHTYSVYYRNSDDYRVGQNVRVVGVVRNGRIAATSLRRV